MKTLLKRLVPNSIKTKITAVTIAVTIITAIVTVSVSFYIFQSFLETNILQTTEFGLQVAMNSIAEDLNSVMTLPAWANTTSMITNFLSKGSSYSKTDKLDAYDRFYAEYLNNNSAEYITRAVIASSSEELYIQVLKTVSEGSAEDYKKVSSLYFFDELVSSPLYKWIGIIDDPLVRAKQIIPIVRPIYSAYNSSVIGWIYISVSSDIITNALNSYTIPTDSDLFITIDNLTYMLKDNKLTLVSFEDVKLDKIDSATLYKGTMVHSLSSDSYSKRTIITYPSSIKGWYISQFISNEQLSEQRQSYFYILIIMCGIIISLGILIVILLNNLINRPVAAILSKVKAISQGDFSVDYSIESADELGEIGKGINELSKNVVILMNKRIDDEKQQQELEYQILQSQINPHFLYNTLNSIKWMATIQNAGGIAEMTTALSRLLKNISKNTRQMIPLCEELALLKDYCLIQEYRYGGVITISYQIESDSLLEYIVPKFSLQPLVENAIFHGIEAKGGEGHVLVSARSSYETLYLCVEDNGIGMSQELINRILNGEEKGTDDFFKKVGINNVNKRIKFAFGEKYGITIDSSPGEYTRMTISLPIRVNNIINGG